MVQIMSDSRQGDRAERASLDGKPEYPNATATCTTITDTNCNSFLPPTRIDSPAHLSPNKFTTTQLPEDYEDFELGGQNSIRHYSEDANNNNSDSEKDSGVVTDPWEATSSITFPEFDDGTEHNSNVSNNSDTMSDPYDLSKIDENTDVVTNFHPNQRNYAVSRKISNFNNKNRKRRTSRGSHSSSKKSSKPMPTTTFSPIITRRRSSAQSTSSATENMDDTNDDSVHLSPQPEGHFNDVDKENDIAPSIPYCYRCYLRFPTYNTWKKHAVFEHILTKNPICVVEMNYVDPTTLQGVTLFPVQTEKDNSDTEMEDEAFHEDSDQFVESEQVNPEINEETQPTHLKLRIGKEKGAYVVRNSAGSSGSVGDVNTTTLQHQPLLPYTLTSGEDALDLLNFSTNLPTQTPSSALAHPPTKTALSNPSSNVIGSNNPPPRNPWDSAVISTLKPRTADLEAVYRRTVSIETELENVFSNVEFEELVQFEKALEMATERSRVTNSPSISTVVPNNSLPAVGSGGIAITSAETRSPPPQQAKMISEDLPLTALAASLGKKDVDASKEPCLPLVSKEPLVESSDSDRPPNLITAEAGEIVPDSNHEISNSEDSKSSNKDADLKHNETSVIGVETISVAKDIINNKDTNLKHQVSKSCENPVELNKLKTLLQTVQTDSGSGDVKNSDKSFDKDNDEKIVDGEKIGHDTQKTRNISSLSTEQTEEVGETESEEVQCSVCHKNFHSDEELNDHFTVEHFRVRNNDILEPESPYPPATPQRSIFANNAEDETPSIPHQRTATRTAQLIQRALSPPPYLERPVQVNLLRRASNESAGVIHHLPFQSAQEELQSLLWRNQINSQEEFGPTRVQHGPNGPYTITMHSSNNSVGSVPRPLNQGHNQGQRISPPTMGGGMSHRQPGYPPNQALPPRPSPPQNQPRPQIQYSVGGQNQPRQMIQGVQGTPRQMMQGVQGPPRQLIQGSQIHQRVSPPFPMSLHNALTGSAPRLPFTQTAQGARPVRQLHPSEQYRINQAILQNNQNNNQRQMQPRGPQPQGNMQMSHTIGMQQQLLNQMNANANAQRELNNQLQQRHPNSMQQQPRLPPPIMQQRPQQLTAHRIASQMQINRHAVAQPQKRTAQIGPIEISEIPLSKEPRMENSHVQPRNLPPAEIHISNAPQQPPLNKNLAAAIGSVGSDGVNSVRLGNSITLSVCSNNSSTSTAHISPSISPALQDSRSSCPASNSSELAVRGVTVTPTSPPIASISSISSPSPSHSPVIQPQNQSVAHNSVIQRGPRSISPADIRRDRNFSPPVMTTVRGSTPVQYNFAVPRAPGPIQRLPSQEGPPATMYSVNSSAERPDRPPTVDLTDDDLHAHNANQRMEQLMLQNGQPAHRRMATLNGVTGQMRPYRCNICGIISPSMQALESHRSTSHGLTKISPPNHNNQSTSPNQPGPTASVSPRFSTQQPTAIRSSLARTIPGQGMNSAGVQPPVRHQVPTSILRNQPPTQFRSQSPNRPNLPNGGIQNQGKYLYIPLLDLSRIDSHKMRKLEEIGISCVVPLQGNNSMAQMGIPVMNLRNDGTNQHVPWDSVLPMGPVHQPTIIDQNNGNRVNNSPNANPNSGQGGGSPMMRFHNN